MHNITTIIFDLGRVLINVEPERGLFGTINRQIKNSDPDLLIKIINDPLIKQHNQGQITSDAFFTQLNEKFNLGLSYDQFLEHWCDIFSPIPEMERLLTQLAVKYKLGMLSDTDPLHWNFIKNNYPFLAIIPNPAFSFEIGRCKPQLQTYLTACSNCGSQPKECLFIDDLEHNVKGAKAAGLNAFRHINYQDTIKKLQLISIL